MWYSAQIADAIHKYGPDYGFNTELKSFNWKKLVENRQAYISRIHTSYDTGLAKIMLMSFEVLQNFRCSNN